MQNLNKNYSFCAI